MEDERADAGCASNANPTYPGPQKYCSLILRIRPSLRDQVAEEKTGHQLPRDGAPESALTRQSHS